MIPEARKDLINSIQAAKELLVRKSRTRFKSFVHYIKEDYSMQWFHAVICDKMDEFTEGRIKKMMILLPPQHGKSELATRLFPAYKLGRHPDTRIAIASYAQNIASGFNRSIQRNIDNEAYGKAFPDTKLNFSQIFRTNFDNFARTDKKFEIIKKKGSVKTVGRGGPLTSEPVDVGIIDDLYKDRAEAKSVTISQATWEWYTDVFKTRLHNDSQQLIMNTRWDDMDLCGRLLIEEPGEWYIIKLPAIRTEDNNDYDPREVGEPLWPAKHSLERLLDTQRQSETTFNSLYQQDPRPNTKLLVYNGWIEIPEFPKEVGQTFWGVDFGFTNDPTVVMKCSIVGMNAYFEECSYEPGIPAKGILSILTANGHKIGEPVYCDHVPEMISELRRLKVAAFSANKNIQAGILKLQEFKCHFTARSANLKRELNNYKWVTYGNTITNEPEDKFNHALDACRYIVYSRYFRQAA
jgi:hypothetical protein